MAGTVEHYWNGTVLTVISDSGTSSCDLAGEKGDTGPRGPQGPAGEGGAFTFDDLTEAQIEELVDSIGEKFVGLTFDTFPTAEEVNAMANGDYFRTNGYYAKNDGLGSVYQVVSAATTLYVPYGDMFIRPVAVSGNYRDINVDLYGIRRGNADYAVNNSRIITALISTLPQGFTIHFASGHYYFAEPIPHIEKNVVIKGAAANSELTNYAVNFGSYLHFPNLADGQAAISIAGGVVQDLGIIGNENVCDVYLNREHTYTSPDSIVSLVDTGTTYGIKLGSWGYTVQNVRIRNCSYGIYSGTTNALISHVDIRRCKIGISIGNDIKINTVKLFDVMTGIQLRGPLASAANIRGDSIGKHLIECWAGKCILSDIDGDYCLGSLIHYGDGGEHKYIHLGQAIGCMGRIATKYAFPRTGSFDLNTVNDTDYEYCSYISIAPNTQVFGGHIEVVNVKANALDTASTYIHPDALISIGTGSTVKGLTIKCNVPYNADLAYFNQQVIKNLSTNAQAENDTTGYITDFDGQTIEDINFITPIGFIRSKRTLAAMSRTLEFSKDANGAVLYEEQALTESQKAKARENIGLDNVSSLEFVASIDNCTDSSKTYVLPDGRTVAYAEKPSYTNQLPLAIDSTGAIYNAANTPGYKLGYFSGTSEMAASLWYITGFIPAKIGDVLRFENMRVLETDTSIIAPSSTKVVFKLYDENFTHITSSGSYSPTNLPSSAWAPAYDEAGNIIQLKIPTSYDTSIRYVRMCVRHLNTDSIITVNEEVGPPTATFGDTGLRFITEEYYTQLKSLETRVAALEAAQ